MMNDELYEEFLQRLVNDLRELSGTYDEHSISGPWGLAENLESILWRRAEQDEG